MLWATVLGTICVLIATACVLALWYPRTAQTLVLSIFSAISSPVTLPQASLGSAVQTMRRAANELFTVAGHRVVDSVSINSQDDRGLRISVIWECFVAVVHLAIFLILTFCGMSVTLLTLAGMFGLGKSWEPPMSLEMLNGIAFTLSVAIVVAVLLDALGLHHFSHLWWQFPNRFPRFVVIAITLALLGTAMLAFWDMATFRYNALQISASTANQSVEMSPDQIEEIVLATEGEKQVHAPTVQPEANPTRRLWFLVPVLIDSAAALAFAGVVPSLIALAGFLVWVASVSVQVLNMVFTLGVHVAEAALVYVRGIVDVLADIGRRLGWHSEVRDAEGNWGPADAGTHLTGTHHGVPSRNDGNGTGTPIGSHSDNSIRDVGTLPIDSAEENVPYNLVELVDIPENTWDPYQLGQIMAS